MNRWNLNTAAVLFAIVALTLVGCASTGGGARSPGVDPTATQILQRMTDYVGSLKKFSVHTSNNLEDELDSGHRIDFGVSVDVLVRRPNKVHAKRRGDLTNQSFYYDGKTLTLYNPSENVYATESAPGTIEEMLDFVRETIGMILPASDLVYRNVYPLLIQDVDMAMVVSKAVVGGVRCDHLLFSRPGVDFQVWVADNGPPLPYRYVVTDTGTPARLSISTVMSDWDVTPYEGDARFTFVPPKDAKQIEFLPIEPY